MDDDMRRAIREEVRAALREVLSDLAGTGRLPPEAPVLREVREEMASLADALRTAASVWASSKCLYNATDIADIKADTADIRTRV